MKRFLLSLIVLAGALICSVPALADMSKLDKGSQSWPKHEGYWVLFVARDYVPGHAFVVWAVRDRKNNKWKAIEGYGLYPVSTNKVAFGTVPGNITLENISSLKGANSGLAVGVTKSMYDYSLRNVKALSKYPEDYNLYNKNCVNFVDLVARSLSIKTPNIENFEKHPQGYIKSLKAKN